MARTLEVTEHDRHVTLTLNRPDAKNALNRAMLDSLNMFVREYVDESGIDAILIHGAGDAFCAGANLKEMRDWDEDDAREHAALAREVGEQLASPDVMTAAAIHGPCLGGGNELALACDFRIASRDAVFGQPEVQLGLIPGYGATMRLPRLVGHAAARTMILSGGKISAAEAERVGLVDRLVDPDGYLEDAEGFVRNVLDTVSMSAYRDAKRLLAETMERPRDEALDAEQDVFADRFDTHDAWEGINAFLKGRDPEFTGE